MSKILLFGDCGVNPPPNSNPHKTKHHPQRAAKRIEAAVVRKIEIEATKPAIALANWKYCWICEEAIAIAGLDTSLCSNPSRSCGPSGWVVNPQYLAANPPLGGKGGAA